MEKNNHCPATYLKLGFVNLISRAPEGCMRTPTILVCRRTRIFFIRPEKTRRVGSAELKQPRNERLIDESHLSIHTLPKVDDTANDGEPPSLVSQTLDGLTGQGASYETSDCKDRIISVLAAKRDGDD
jgi:hypothetical protein